MVELDIFEDSKAFRGFSLWQPMAWAISDLPEEVAKRIENRSWKPWSGVKYIAVHASSTYDRGYKTFIEDLVGVKVPARRDIAMGAIVAVARLAGCVEESDDRWFGGPYGWLLADVMKVPEPIKFRGAQGLWEIPTHLRLQLGRMYAKTFENRMDGANLEHSPRLQLRIPGM